MDLHLTTTDKRNARWVIEEELGDANTWPSRERKLFNSTHLQKTDRFNLVNFLVNNGIHGDWILAHCDNQGALRDDYARRDVCAMWKRYFNTGTVCSETAYIGSELIFYYDVGLGCECLSGPFSLERFCWAVFKVMEVTPGMIQISLVARILTSSPGEVVEVNRRDVKTFAKLVASLSLGNRQMSRRAHAIVYAIATSAKCSTSIEAEELLLALMCV